MDMDHKSVTMKIFHAKNGQKCFCLAYLRTIFACSEICRENKKINPNPPPPHRPLFFK